MNGDGFGVFGQRREPVEESRDLKQALGVGRMTFFISADGILLAVAKYVGYHVKRSVRSENA